MSLPARTGWDWFKAGFGLFRTQPGILMMFVFTNFMVSMLLSALPFIGPLLAVLLIPSFSMASFEACRQIDHARKVSFDVLLTGFRAPMVKQLCKLGVVYLVVSVLLTILMRVMIDRSFFEQFAGANPNQSVSLAGSDMLSLLLILALQAVVLLVLSFAAPLVYWQKMMPGKATFYSVFGVLGAKRAFFTMLITWAGCFMAIALLMTAVFGNGSGGRVIIVWLMLLFVLVLQCALYAAYRQIFGVPDDASQPDLTKR
jgi:hypothetical protein